MIFINSNLKVGAIVLVLAASVLTPLAVSAATQPRDCDTNAIVYCGSYSKPELNKKIANGDTRNSAANLKQIFFNEGRGITAAGIGSAVEGTVYKDGRVVVAGKTVATGAMSSGRQYMPGSTKQGSVWVRSVGASFASNSIPAYVNMDGGVFHWAIIKSCGNTVTAKAVPKPTPTPTPVPTKTPTPTPTPTKTPTPSPTHTPSPTPVVTPTPTTTPTPVPVETLPDTGAAGTLGGVLGLGSIGYASQAYLRSKTALSKSQKRK